MNTAWCPIERASQIIGDRWSLLILRELSLGPQRFKALKENISSISMDQLSRKLDHLCCTQMIVRQEFSEAPPRVEYQLTELGLSFMPVLKRLFFWGSQSLWTAPAPDEVADPALSLRVMASMLGQGDGLVLLRLFTSTTAFKVYLIHRSAEGRVRVQLLDEPQRAQSLMPDVQVELSLEDWIKLLSAKDKTQLQVKVRVAGDINLLQRILPVFSRPGVHEGPNRNGDNDSVSRKDTIRASL